MARYRLGSICQIISGSTPKTGVQEYWNGDKKWITPAELSESDYIIYDTERKLTEAGVRSAGLTPLPKGTVILSSRAPIGKVAIAGCEMYCNQGFKNFVCSNIINNKYLYWYLRSKTDFLNSLGRGATFKEISKSTVADIELDIPELSEQSKRVAHLEKLQSIIASRQIQLAKLDELVKCRFVEMFGDPVLNEKAWPCENFSKYIEFITSGSRGWAKYYSDKGSYFITIKNVKKCNITTENVQYVNPPNNAEATRTKVEEGDLLISITADLGRTGVVTKEIAQYGAYINQHLTCVRIRKGCLHPVYVAHFLETDAGKMQFLSKNQNAVKAGLNFDAIKSIQLLIPPISEQEHFVSFLARIDKLRIVIRQSLDEAQKLFDSLMQEYFD